MKTCLVLVGIGFGGSMAHQMYLLVTGQGCEPISGFDRFVGVSLAVTALVGIIALFGGAIVNAIVHRNDRDPIDVELNLMVEDDAEKTNLF